MKITDVEVWPVLTTGANGVLNVVDRDGVITLICDVHLRPPPHAMNIPRRTEQSIGSRNAVACGARGLVRVREVVNSAVGGDGPVASRPGS